MPIVPIYKTKETSRNTDITYYARSTGNLPEAKDQDESSLRMELAKAVRTEANEKGNVSESFLDRFAMTHLNVKDTDSPVLHDYAALRHTAQKETVLAEQKKRDEELHQEVTWMKQVGALSADVASLEAYLKLQIPALSERMKQAGFPDQEVQKTVEGVRKDTIQYNILRSLAVGDWQTAYQVFQTQKSAIPQYMQNHFTEKIRHSFARFEASQAWKKAKGYSKQSGVSTKDFAFSLLQEPDENLRQMAEWEITCLEQQDKRQTAFRQAEFFAQLLQADAEQAQQLLDVQTVLDEQEIQHVRKAVMQIQQPANKQQEHWFVQHYFEKGSLTPDQAFDKALCTARDCFYLKTARLREQSGENLSQDKWLCRGLQVWMKHQGFGEEDITRATYTVLTGAPDTPGRAAVWKTIKNLLTC